MSKGRQKVGYFFKKTVHEDGDEGQRRSKAVLERAALVAYEKKKKKRLGREG